MNLAIQNAWKHPLSTLMGVLSAVGGFYTLLATDPDFAPLKAVLPPVWAGRMAIAALVVKLVLRAGQKDVGREEATLPGYSQPQMVDAHEVPNAGKPVDQLPHQ